MAHKGRLGWWCAVGAYVSWGLFPLYWRILESINVWEVLCHRIVWSALPLAAYMLIKGRLRETIRIISETKQKAIYLSSCLLIAFNWGIFVWAISQRLVLECSLGYFLSPLFQVALGVVVLGESVRPLAKVSILVVAFSLVGLLIWQQHLPLVSIGLGLSFALYGLLRKCGKLSSWEGLTVETLLLFVPALLILFYLWGQGGETLLSTRWNLRLLLVSAGVITVIPLVLYTTAARCLPLSALGLLQYIGPSIQYWIARYIFAEDPAAGMSVIFPIIWCALALFVFDQWRMSKETVNPAQA